MGVVGSCGLPSVECWDVLPAQLSSLHSHRPPVTACLRRISSCAAPPLGPRPRRGCAEMCGPALRVCPSRLGGFRAWCRRFQPRRAPPRRMVAMHDGRLSPSGWTSVLALYGHASPMPKIRSMHLCPIDLQRLLSRRSSILAARHSSTHLRPVEANPSLWPL